MGWRSTFLEIDPPAFLGSAPIGGPASMTQYKRWATGLLEVLVGWNSPLLALLTKKLCFRQCLAYVLFNIWSLRSIPELCYALLAPYCAIANTSFIPKASEPMMVVPVILFVFYNVYTLTEYLECGLSACAWWNNQRMVRIITVTAWLLGLLSVIAKILGLSETTFEVTPKDQNTSTNSTANDKEDPRRFTFDASPLFLSGTTIVLLNLVALPVCLLKVLGSSLVFTSDDGPGIGELVCSGWVVLSFWPFVRGLLGKGSYGLPWPTIVKASLLASLFLLLCKWTS
uniref:Putative cellulose synthase-like protein H3 n=1 Tax=Anthurium amnicola TaxID=1678845 RepID=A0A1D1ZAH5_9ARAE